MYASSVNRIIQDALAYHQAGRLVEAHGLYNRVLEAEPSNPSALHFLGIVYGQLGQPLAGAGIIGRACELDPSNPAFHNNHGNLLRRAGEPGLATRAFRRAIALDAAYAEAYNNLGNALADLGQFKDAVSSYRKAIELQPSLGSAWDNLGVALRESGNPVEAVAAHQSALRLTPGAATTLIKLAMAFREAGDAERARRTLLEAVQRDPRSNEAYRELGNTLQKLKRHEESVVAHRRALELVPSDAAAMSNMGNVYGELGQIEAALEACRKSVELCPGDPHILTNLAVAVARQGDLTQAISICRQALVARADFPPAVFNLAVFLMLNGEFEEGFRQHERRWYCTHLFTPREFATPQWDGSPLNGATILIHAEQGFGDNIQFCRYLPLVAARGGRIVFECQPELQRLLRSVPGIAQMISCGDPLPPYDTQCSTFSLPYVFGTTLETVPAPSPYLFADAALISQWADKLPPRDGRLRVGIVWAGHAAHANDRMRSLRLADLAPLTTLPEFQFVSLQKGPATEQTADTPSAASVLNFSSDLTDFAETAALIANLDLVVAVDTSVVHLVAALGKPTWVLLPSHPDWRWLLNRDDSPWYPTIRLFRQPGPWKWKEAIERVRSAMLDLVHTPAASA